MPKKRRPRRADYNQAMSGISAGCRINEEGGRKIAGRCSIRFKNGELGDLRANLLADLSHEHFAVLLGKTEEIGGNGIITIH